MPDLSKTTLNSLEGMVSSQLNVFSNVRHAFFTRIGGVDEGEHTSGLNFRFTNAIDEEKIIQNYALAAQALGFGLDNIVRTRQEHTDNIAVVKSHHGFGPALGDTPVDGLMTNVPGICLTGFFADCQLVLLYDSKNKAIALIHAGWRGIRNQIVAKAISKMGEEYGTRPKDLTAAVSPSICRNCFETDDDVYRALIETYGERLNDYIYRHENKWHIDLKNITYFVLQTVGVPPFCIDISTSCPCCGDQRLFWSHRRCGDERGVHAGMICLK